MQYKAVRMERRSAFRHEPDLVHHRPRVLRRIEIHVGRQVYMQGRALAVKDAGYLSDFPGRSELFAACARLQQQQGYILAALRRESHCRNIALMQQKRGTSKADSGNGVSLHNQSFQHCDTAQSSQQTVRTTHSVSSMRQPKTSPVTPPSRF